MNKLTDSEKRMKGRLGSRGGNEWKGFILPCAALTRRKAGPLCAGAGLRSAPSAAYPLCFTLSTVIRARVIQKGMLDRDGHRVSLYPTALQTAAEILLHICFTTDYCRSHEDKSRILPQGKLVPEHICAGGFLLGTAQTHGLAFSYHCVWGLFQSQHWKGKGRALRTS